MSTCTVIMYHYVRDLANSRYPEIKGLDIALFRKQIDALEERFKFIKIEDVIASIEHGEDLPENSALLTFDDGYIDHYTNVFPILMRKKIQGSFYIPTQIIEDKKVLGVNKIHFILASVDNKEQLVKDIYNEIDIYREKYNLLSNEEYFQKHGIPNRFDSGTVIFIKRILQHVLPSEIRESITDKLFKKHVTFDEAAFSQELYVSEDQIKLMHESGMHIGGHGANHLWFAEIDSISKHDEMKKSIDFLNRMTNNYNIKSISYPYGSYDNETTSLAEEYGFNIGFTTKVDLAHLDQKNKMTLSRFDTNDFK